MRTIDTFQSMNAGPFGETPPAAGFGIGDPLERKTSGKGIAALVLGGVALLIGWFPACGSIPALLMLLVGVPLAIIGIVGAVRGRVGYGFPITGLVVCLVALAVASLATLVLIGGFQWGKKQAEERTALRAELAATATEEWKQATLFLVESPSSAAGTGFVVHASDDEPYAVTAIHPYEGETPTLFDDLFPETRIELGDVVGEGDDVRIQRLATELQSGVTTLRLVPQVGIRKDDRVALLTIDGPVLATVTKTPLLGRDGEMELDTPTDVAGSSGAPIVLVETGTVVAVALSADDPLEATMVGFEKLVFDPTKQDPTSPF